MAHDIKNLEMADEGKMKIEWAERQIPVLRLIKEEFQRDKPLDGKVIGCCLHVTSETANLCRTLKAGGAEVHLCASNPLSTQDDVAASLVKDYGINVYAIRGEDRDLYYRHVHQVLDAKPNVTMDDGGDLVSTIMKEREDILEHIVGGTEETTTGVIRFKSMERDGVLKYPLVAVNDADTKHLFDNRYGTGQSTMDGIIRATNILVAGKVVVVGGYGWCGRGIAVRAKGLGGRVIVLEINPVKALEACMDGFDVMTGFEAAKIGDIFVTATGNRDVLRKEHFELLKDGAIICNSGHFNVEIDIEALEKLSVSKRRVRHETEEFVMKDGRKILLLSDGRLVNLAAAEGHPAAVMDMSFANQSLTAKYILENGSSMVPKVYTVPEDIDRRVAVLKLKSMGKKIDILTPEQEEYLSSWTLGT